ncbi:MAG: hypothetical protein WBD48_05625 [Pseudolabrys sp.]|jgi:hypothetical protein
MTSTLNRAALAPALAALALIAITQTAYAQPTSAQQSAMRSNCRSDFMSKCSGVTPGGKEALECLQKNVATLSPACKSAVSATLPAPATASAPPPAAPKAPPPPRTAARPPAPKTASAPPKAAAPAAAPAAVETEQQATGGGFVPGAGIVMKACARDLLMHCPGIAGNGKAVACLKAREAGGHRLGIRCGIALKMQAKMQH